MAEAIVTNQLLIQKGNLQYQSLPGSFQATVTGSGGPTPGAISVSIDGVDINLAALTTPGLCRLQNLDATNNIAVGVWNPDQSEFYPLLYLKPGESYVIRLHPHVNQEYAGTGTGTTGQLNTLRAQAENAACLLLVEAFED